MFRSIQTKFAHHALNTIGVFTQSGDSEGSRIHIHGELENAKTRIVGKFTSDVFICGLRDRGGAGKQGGDSISKSDPSLRSG